MQSFFSNIHMHSLLTIFRYLRLLLIVRHLVFSEIKGAIFLKQAEAPLDPTKELSRLISERKFEEAFTGALHRSDVSIVSWLCSLVSSAYASVCVHMFTPIS